MKILQSMKHAWQRLSKNNPHQPNRAANLKMWLIVIAIVIALLGLVFLYKQSQKTTKKTAAVDEIDFVSIHDADFTAADNRSALLDQQETMDQLQQTLKNQNQALKELKSAFETLKEETKQLKEKPAEQPQGLTDNIFNNKTPSTIEPTLNPDFSQSNLDAFNQGNEAHSPQMMVETSPRLEITELQLPAPEAPVHKRTAENYVPSGTFCQGVLLGGAYAPSGASAQNDTVPIIFEITDNCHLPNGQASLLKGARVTASVYGKISADRGMVRLDNLSFINRENEILDIPVEGTAFDHSGKTGIRGTTLLRNGKLIRMSGISGLFSGLGEAAKAYTQTQSVSSLGATNSVDPSKIPLYATGSGLTTAMDKVSEYYIKLAEQYQPVIELNSGAVVDIVFLKGFPIDNQDRIHRYTQDVFQSRDAKKETQNPQTNGLVQKMIKPLSEAQLGDGVEPFMTGANG